MSPVDNEKIGRTNTFLILLVSLGERSASIKNLKCCASSESKIDRLACNTQGISNSLSF